MKAATPRRVPLSMRTATYTNSMDAPTKPTEDTTKPNQPTKPRPDMPRRSTDQLTDNDKRRSRCEITTTKPAIDKALGDDRQS